MPRQSTWRLNRHRTLELTTWMVCFEADLFDRLFQRSSIMDATLRLKRIAALP